MTDVKKILVVEDDADIRKLLEVTLTRENYVVRALATGESVIKELGIFLPDLVLLDIMLPVTDGRRLCQNIKNNPAHSRLPVIMLTAKGDESDIITGLELGADDYIVKPFSPRVLLARVRAILRRGENDSPDQETEITTIHDIMIHSGRHEVLLHGEPIKLTLTEFQILCLLAGRPGWVFTRDQIVDRIRGEGYAVTARAVDVQIVGLRKKMGDNGHFVETVRGVGYKMIE